MAVVASFANITLVAKGEGQKNRVAGLCHGHAGADFLDIPAPFVTKYARVERYRRRAARDVTGEQVCVTDSGAEAWRKNSC